MTFGVPYWEISEIIILSLLRLQTLVVSILRSLLFLSYGPIILMRGDVAASVRSPNRVYRAFRSHSSDSRKREAERERDVTKVRGGYMHDGSIFQGSERARGIFWNSVKSSGSRDARGQGHELAMLSFHQFWD